jgi:hypothetical protein
MKIHRTFTLDHALAEELKARAGTEGRAMSLLVARGLKEHFNAHQVGAR